MSSVVNVPAHPQKTVRRTTSTNPDDSRSVATVTKVVNPDGSITVTQRIQTIPAPSPYPAPASATAPEPETVVDPTVPEPEIVVDLNGDAPAIFAAGSACPGYPAAAPAAFPTGTSTAAQAGPLPPALSGLPPNTDPDPDPEAPFCSEPPDEAKPPKTAGFSLVELAKSRRTWRVIALLSLVYDLITDAIVLFSFITEELENILAMTFAFDLVIFGFFVWNWNQTTDPPYSFRKMFIPTLALMGILVPDTAETTISVLYLRNCGIDFIFFVKLLKNVLRMPVELVQSAKELLAIQKWHITNTHGEEHERKNRCQVRGSLLFLAALLLLCGIVVPLANIQQMQGGECKILAD